MAQKSDEIRKWVTPLGRVFKIRNVFLHGFDKKLIS